MVIRVYSFQYFGTFGFRRLGETEHLIKFIYELRLPSCAPTTDLCNIDRVSGLAERLLIHDDAGFGELNPFFGSEGENELTKYY